MNTDLAFVATPAKCRLLLSLQQYDKKMGMNIPNQVIEIAKQDCLPVIFEDIEQQQVIQFLADIGNRAAIVKAVSQKYEHIDLSFIVKSAELLGHKDIIIFSAVLNFSKKYYALKNTKISVFNPTTFFKDENFHEEVKKYENYLVIFDMETMSSDSLYNNYNYDSIFYHFKKIWVFTEYYSEINVEHLKKCLTNGFKYNYDSGYSTLYNGMLDLNSKNICYYPKLKFPEIIPQA